MVGQGNQGAGRAACDRCSAKMDMGRKQSIYLFYIYIYICIEISKMTGSHRLDNGFNISTCKFDAKNIAGK